jgi:hypothetical protein
MWKSPLTVKKFSRALSRSPGRRRGEFAEAHGSEVFAAARVHGHRFSL